MKNHALFYFRLILLILGIIASIWHLILSTHAIQFFTEQSNFFIQVWLVLALVSQFKEKSLTPIQGKLRGALILYIAVTCLVNAVVLGGGELSYNNIIQHYVVPIFSILDWILTERNVQYRWSYLGIWLIYPLSYCIIAILIGSLTGFFPYFFVNYNLIGVGMMIVWILILIVVFVVIGFILILINRKRFENQKTN